MSIEVHKKDAIAERLPLRGTANGDGTASLDVSVTGSYVGYSTDTKPTGVNKGDSFLELDTKNVYIYDGADWVVI